MEMKTEVIIAIVALLVSIGSFVHSWMSSRRKNRVEPMLAYLVQLAQIEAEIGVTPSALEFHGISIDELDQAGITPKEFAYLVASFTAGGAWFEAFSDGKTSPYKVGNYRWQICSSQKTQKAWPLLKRMMDDSPYRAKVEATILAARDSKA